MTLDPGHGLLVAHDGRGPLDPAEEKRIRRTDREAQLNLRIVLGLCAEGRLKCSESTRRPTASTCRTLDDFLSDGDYYYDEPIATVAWPLLVQAGGLADLDGGRMQLTAKGNAAARKPAAEVIRQLWSRWLNHAVIDEFSRIDHIKGQRGANVLTAATNRRRVVADAMALCPVGEWLGIDEFFVIMRRHGLNPTIARSERAQWRLYLVDREYGSLGYEGFGDWEILEGRYTLAVLFEYAATLGLIDVDYVHPAGARDDFREIWGTDDFEALSRYDGLRAIRLTELGAYALGLQDGYDPAGGQDISAWLSIGPGLDVRATGALPPDDELTLTTWCATTAPGQWQLSPAGLLAGVETGHDIDEFATFLRDRSGGVLPGDVESLLKDVRMRASRLSDRGLLRVIRCHSASLADEIHDDPELGHVCLRIGPRELGVPVRHEPRVRARLFELGYVLPAPKR